VGEDSLEVVTVPGFDPVVCKRAGEGSRRGKSADSIF
jgi:hypothetical protein